MIQLGDTYERNTIDNLQYIMKVIGVKGRKINFNMSHKDPENGTSFEHEMDEDMVNILVRQHKMAKI